MSYFFRWLLLSVVLCGMTNANAQGPLSRSISVKVQQQRLDHVLEIISNTGDFYFSYNSKLVKKDSLVSLSVTGKTVLETLQLLFGSGYEFRESGQYIIIRRAPIPVKIVTQRAVKQEKFYFITGHVYDESSGIPLYNASVYEKKRLSASLTSTEGFFRLRLKSYSNGLAEITVSKEFYEDTTVVIEAGRDQELNLTLMPFEAAESNVIVSPDDYLAPDTLQQPAVPGPPVAAKQDTSIVERTGLGRFLLSTKQKAQSLNIRHFFTNRPFQVSLTPGLSTHGRLGSQVINNFSLNVLGGYTAGTNGGEVGGLFNINQRDVQYFQAAGLFNVVGGSVKGMQVGGVTNLVLKPVTGFQAAGVGNYVKGRFTGLQVGGVYNHVADSMRGFQAAGVGNFVRKTVSGVQVSGLINISSGDMRGVQIGGVFNYAKRLKGVQFGLINIADTSDGYSIGLINIILKGYHKLSLSTNELMLWNASFKTGSHKLYSILMAGMHPENDKKLYAFGYGLGSELYPARQKVFSINPEISAQYLYRGTWEYLNLLNRFQLNFTLHLGRHVALYGGPAFSVFISDQRDPVEGYRFDLPPGGKRHDFSQRVTGWMGWNAGIHLF